MATVVADLSVKTPENAKRQFVELYGAPLLLNRYLKIALVLTVLLAASLVVLNFRTQARYAHLKPLVIRINDVGRAEAVDYDATTYRPQAPELRYFLTRFRFSGGELIAPGVDAEIGSRVRIRIRSRDVALAIRKPEGISIRNVLEGRVSTVADSGGAIVEVSVRLGETEIPARISRQAMTELALTPGLPVFVLIKAIAFDKRSVGLSA